jgi:hypothetical protein
MTRIIYHPPSGEDAYVLDKTAQEVLSYLYLTSGKDSQTIAESISVESEDQLFKIIKGNLLHDTTGFVELGSETEQMNLQGEVLSTVTVELTTEGKQFVEQHESEIAVPFIVEQYVSRIEHIRRNIRDDLREMEGVIYEFEDLDTSDVRLEELMKKIEDNFKELRQATVSIEDFPIDE